MIAAATKTKCTSTPILRGAELRAAYPSQLKRCNKCGEQQELREYGVSPRNSDGLSTICDTCRLAAARYRRADRRHKRASKALRTLCRTDVSIQQVTGATRVLSDALGGWSNAYDEILKILQSGSGTLRTRLLIALLNCQAAATHLRAERIQLEADVERVCADAATVDEVLDAAIDMIRRQPRKRRLEIIRLIQRRGPDSYEWDCGGGI